jgi:uncharacterized protein (DUF58 family)
MRSPVSSETRARIAGRVARATDWFRASITPLGAMVAGLGVLGLVTAWWLDWEEALVVAFVALVLVVVATCYLFGPVDLEVDLELPQERVTVGESAAARVVARNPAAVRRGGQRIEVRVGRAFTSFEIPVLAGRQEHDELMVLPTNRRQIIPIGPVTVVREDPLRLARRSVERSEELQLFVHPRTVALDNLGAGFLRDLDGQPTPDVTSSGVAFHALREYQHGDDRRFVHWRTTARTGTLMLKQFVDTRRSHLAIALDLRADGYESADEFELAVSAAASLAARAFADGQELTFSAGLKTWSPPSRTQLFDRLAGVDLDAGSPMLTRQIMQLLQAATGISTAIVVTGTRRTLAEQRVALARLGPSVSTYGLRVGTSGDASLRTLSDATLLDLPRLEDLPVLLWTVLHR